MIIESNAAGEKLVSTGCRVLAASRHGASFVLPDQGMLQLRESKIGRDEARELGHRLIAFADTGSLELKKEGER